MKTWIDITKVAIQSGTLLVAVLSSSPAKATWARCVSSVLRNAQEDAVTVISRLKTRSSGLSALSELARRVENPPSDHGAIQVERVGRHRILEVSDPGLENVKIRHMDPVKHAPVPGTTAMLFPHVHPLQLSEEHRFYFDRYQRVWSVHGIHPETKAVTLMRSNENGLLEAITLNPTDYKADYTESMYRTPVEISLPGGKRHSIDVISPAPRFFKSEVIEREAMKLIQEQARALVARFPLNVVETTEKFYFQPRQASKWVQAEVRQTTMNPQANVAGIAESRTVYLFQHLNSTHQILDTIYHELGHNFVHWVFQNFDPGPIWKRARELDGTQVSNYGEMSVVEDIAESFAFYIGNPPEFRSRHRHRAAFLDAFFGPDDGTFRPRSLARQLHDYHVARLRPRRSSATAIAGAVVVVTATGWYVFRSPEER